MCDVQLSSWVRGTPVGLSYFGYTAALYFGCGLAFDSYNLEYCADDSSETISEIRFADRCKHEYHRRLYAQSGVSSVELPVPQGQL